MEEMQGVFISNHAIFAFVVIERDKVMFGVFSSDKSRLFSTPLEDNVNCAINHQNAIKVG